MHVAAAVKRLKIMYSLGRRAIIIYRPFLTAPAPWRLSGMTVPSSGEKGLNCYQTLRWRLFQTAGKVVDRANRVSLKVRRGLYALFEKIRLRIWEFADT